MIESDKDCEIATMRILFAVDLVTRGVDTDELMRSVVGYSVPEFMAILSMVSNEYARLKKTIAEMAGGES